MNTHESVQALHRANPRTEAHFRESIEAVRTRVGTPADLPASTEHSHRRRVTGAAAGVSLAALAVAVALAGIGSPGSGSGVVGVQNAAAAVRQAATLTAVSAERSGTATVRITHDGELWAARTVSWNGDDLSLEETSLGRDGLPGRELRVVDGIMYEPDPEAPGWLRLGSTDTIDPGSGTTPAEYLAAVREDVGGTTLRRLSDGIAGLTARSLDSSTVYSGTVQAGLIARKTGFKEGQAIRLLPFGYVAHDEAADPRSSLQAAVTVDANRVVREIAVSWGTWRYAVIYSALGATPAPVVPADVHGLKRNITP
jgi:hypothetical protein